MKQVFRKTASGAMAERPQLGRLREAVRPGDVIVIWKLGWLGRSLRHLFSLVHGLMVRGVAL